MVFRSSLTSGNVQVYIFFSIFTLSLYEEPTQKETEPAKKISKEKRFVGSLVDILGTYSKYDKGIGIDDRKRAQRSQGLNL